MPGEAVHAVARGHGVNTSQLFTWRKRLRAQPDLPAAPVPAPVFAAVEIAPSAAEAMIAQLKLLIEKLRPLRGIRVKGLLA